MSFLLHDVRDAWRSVRRTPAYSLLVILTLALGIGVTTAIFSVTDGLLFRALPYREADRLVQLTERHPSGNRNTVAPANFLDWQRLARSFTAIEARQARSYALLDGGDPVDLRGARVSVGYFDLLGIAAASGRVFQPADGVAGAPCVVIISHRLWRTRFGEQSGRLGAAVRFSGETCTLVGVLPRDSVFDRVISDVYTPLIYPSGAASRKDHLLTVLARLAPGVSIAQARDEISALAARINAEHADILRGWSATADPLRDLLVRGDSRRLVWVLFGAVALVLLVGCVNIAGLALSRTIARAREVAVRLALGAGRWRVFRAVVMESLMLSALGAALGVIVGRWALGVFASFVPAGTLPPEAVATLDARALLFTAALGIATGLLCGTLPAWQGTRTGLQALRSGGRGASASRVSARFRSLLLVAEVALAMVLVAGAALLVVSFLRLTRVDPGFRADGVATIRVSLPVARYQEAASWSRFFDAALVRIRQLPGVEHAAAVTSLPLGGWLFGQTVTVEGVAADPERVTSAHIQHVSGDYVATLGMPLKEGRAIADTDTAASPGVVMVNETFVRRFIGDQPAVGRFIRIGGGTGSRLQIVGVMRDVKTGALRDSPLLTPEMYVSHQQFPMPALSLAIQAKDDEAAVRLLPDVRASVRAIDAELPIGELLLMSERLGSSVTLQRFQTTLVSSFAVLAGLLACIGVYSVRSQAVHARQREVGIRLALGATPRQVLAMAVRQGAGLVAVGLVIGLTAAALLAGVIEPWLFNTRTSDPATLAIAAVCLGAAGLAASWIPARRAARLDPLTTLRTE